MSVSFVGRHVISNHDIDQRCPLHVGRHKCNFYTTNLYTNFYTKQFFLQLIIFTLTRFYIIDTSYASNFYTEPRLTLDSLYTRQLFTTRTFYTTHLALPFSQRLHQTKFHIKCCPCHANPGPETDNRDAPEHSRTQADVGDTDNKQGAQVLRQDSNM